jgi:DNA-binding NtrC family response regulator
MSNTAQRCRLRAGIIAARSLTDIDAFSRKARMQVIPCAEPTRERNQQTVQDDDLAARSAETTVLITAASTADIESRARSIHAASARAVSPFVQVTAATLPADSKAFTEACAKLFTEAGGGSLLLHQIEGLHAINQSRLIETLAELTRNVREPSRTVRLIAGTTTSLRRRVASGTFSDRLFYRLNIIHVVVPSDSPISRADDAPPRERAMRY